MSETVFTLGCPKVIRSDYGTENCIVAKLQIAFRMHHNDSLSAEHSYIYGPSTANTVLSYIINAVYAMFSDNCRELKDCGANGHVRLVVGGSTSFGYICHSCDSFRLQFSIIDPC